MVTTASSLTSAPENIFRLEDAKTGLSGIIVVHSTVLGPAAGGCRFFQYHNSSLAVADALRLAEGMTYKNAIARLPLGGGKAVINVPAQGYDRARLFAAFGRAVQSLGGQYITAEDIGTTVADMENVATTTRHVAGLPAREGRAGGDPSPWTARGVISAMRLLAETHLGRALSECTVAVQGLGQVGSELVALLDEVGARLIVADPKAGVAARVAGALRSAEIMSKDAIFDAKADIFAPCALGGVLDEIAVKRLKVKLVCGAANNQLAHDGIDDLLAARNILYAPDFVVNAGGIISVAAEYFGWPSAELQKRVDETGKRMQLVLDEARVRGIPPHAAAATAARRIIANAPNSAIAAAA